MWRPKKKKGRSDLETKRVGFAQIVAVCIDFQIFKNDFAISVISASTSQFLIPPLPLVRGGVRLRNWENNAAYVSILSMRQHTSADLQRVRTVFEHRQCITSCYGMLYFSGGGGMGGVSRSGGEG
jgi:hypothetical protein